MSFSLNCLVLGQDIRNGFNIPFGETYKLNGVDIKFKDLTVSNFKDVLFSRKELHGITAMNIWKVEIESKDIMKFSTEDDIKNQVKSKMMDDNPMMNLNEYYNDEDKKPKKGLYLHIFIVPITAGKCTLIFTSRTRNLQFITSLLRHVLLTYFFFCCFSTKSLP
jgi:hypothetical protein